MTTITYSTDAVAPFRVVLVVPRYDNRDAICGQQSFRDAEGGYFETFGGALHRACRVAEQEPETYVSIRDINDHEVHSPPAPRPVTYGPDDLPF